MPRAFALSLVLSLGAVVSAEATPIVISPGATLAGNAAALGAFNRASLAIGSMLTDPILVTVSADLQNLGSPNVIGQTQPVFLQAGYATIRNAMVADAANEADDAIVAALPTAAQFSANVIAGSTFTGNMVGTKANLKALGFAGLDGAFGAADGTITFNSGFAFDYDNSDGVGAGLVDFETVALHELLHILGFMSIVDVLDGGGAASISFFTLDMFRFSAANTPTTTAQFTNNPRNFVPGLAANTSDAANAWAMSTGVVSGDGRQASHWRDDGITGIRIGVMDPTLAAGASYGLSAADIRALDLIGWDNVAVPEPASLVLVGSGLMALVWRRKRRGPGGR